MELLAKTISLLHLIKKEKPLIHHITNLVTINDCANITLAIGASPIMAVDKNEVEEVVAMASSLVLNIGTLTTETVASMLLAGKKANNLGIPVVLDPVGVGIAALRNRTVETILKEIKISVLRGNMSEIKFLAGTSASLKGVDSTADSVDGEKTARELARHLGCVVVITGKKDVLADGNKTYLAGNGHAILRYITGTGCMVSSLIAAYCAVTDDYLAAALGGVVTMGIAGEIAYELLRDGEGPGTLKYRLFDCVFNLTADTVIKRGIVRPFR